MSKAPVQAGSDRSRVPEQIQSRVPWHAEVI
jgi:hypothetical protein